MSPYVGQIYIYGDGYIYIYIYIYRLRDYLVAIVVPDEAYAFKRAKELGISIYSRCRTGREFGNYL